MFIIGEGRIINLDGQDIFITEVGNYRIRGDVSIKYRTEEGKEAHAKIPMSKVCYLIGGSQVGSNYGRNRTALNTRGGVIYS